MPALEGDSAYGEGVELYERDVLLEVLKLSYPGRYPVGDSDAESEPSTYEVFFDELLNETLFLVRQVLKADLPRSPATYWSSILADLRAKTDSDPARHSLVVDLAKTLMEPLEHVTSHPKRMLKRIRDQQRVQLVQEIDTHCLIDLARRPGSTMPEKAGPKQRVMAVTRHENIDLLENRVARHCCELLRRAAGRYLHSHQRVGRSERKQQVEKLFRNSKRWPSKPTVSGVGRLLSPCRQPNYALLQNIHYSRIWDGYSKLVRNEELRDGLWRWPRRLWMDRVGVYVADTVLSWAERSRHAVCINTADRLVQASHRHECGAWLSSDIMPGPFIVGMSSAEAGTLHIIDGRHPGVIDAKFGETSLLCSDFLAFLVKGSVIRALPIYAIWPSPCEAPGLDKAWWERIVGDVLESIALFNRRAKHVVAVGALLVHGSWDASSRNGPWHTATRDDLTCWQTALRPDASSWPTDIADRYRPFDVLTGG
ncbi:MAG: DUF2357 domain-containing protein [Kiritimatiellae bacterium]|nr:DUF2357 domain-containing protein [Verrucomicrobiota bacterium]MCG2679286.1 DUF2357 domain-containing protein [Kiritimatiellia bacterium]